MHHPHKMANLHNAHNAPANRSGGLLAVMPLGNNPIKELSTCTQLHDKMHGLLILVGALELDDIRLPTEMLHDLNLSLHILLVALGNELLLGYGLAGQFLTGDDIGAEMGDPELAPAQLFPEDVVSFDILVRLAEDGVGFVNWRVGAPRGDYVGQLSCVTRGHCVLDWGLVGVGAPVHGIVPIGV